MRVEFALLSLLIFGTAECQKLPNVQINSLQAPASVKTDGKATEWGNNLQAYDHNTNIFYTMANSYDRLYLTIQAKDNLIARKIIAGGVTIVLSNKKDEKKYISYLSFVKR